MPATVSDRLGHIQGAVANIRTLLDGKQLEDVARDAITRAALERFLEIISEASRHIPGALKALHPQIEWIDIRDIGNRLRHGYDAVDMSILWDIYRNDLDPLERAVEDLMARQNCGG